MTEKDPKDMTASELLRWCAAEDGMLRVSCTLCMKFYQTCGCGGHRCEDLLKDIADKIDAEIEAARRDAAKEPRKPMFAIRRIIASGTDWPEPREGEGLRDWLERCWLPRPRYEDGEPVQFGDEIELHYRGGGMDKGRFQEVKVNRGPVCILSFTGVDHALEYRYDSEFDVIKLDWQPFSGHFFQRLRPAFLNSTGL
ncbi:hypothetical protein, partial [Adlercreutzia caecimuris]|uniref:hypothetical protein n=1 Tax=Adlercreutzia caecimuris TaxID=671266 RepID=UPI001372717F